MRCSKTLTLYLPLRALWHTQHRRHANIGVMPVGFLGGMKRRRNRLHHLRSSTIMANRPLKFHAEFSILQDCCVPSDHNFCVLFPLQFLHPWQLQPDQLITERSVILERILCLISANSAFSSFIPFIYINILRGRASFFYFHCLCFSKSYLL